MLRAASCALLLVLVVGGAFAQQATNAEDGSKTKLEAFQRQTGTVVVKDYSNVGSVSSLGTVSVIAMSFTDATTGKKETGVVIEVKEGSRVETVERSFIDYDEVEALLKGIDYIAKVDARVSSLGTYEATYKTKGYLNVTTFNDQSGNIQAAVKSGYVRSAEAYLSLEELSELRALIAAAKGKLDSTK